MAMINRIHHGAIGKGSAMMLVVMFVGSILFCAVLLECALTGSASTGIMYLAGGCSALSYPLLTTNFYKRRNGVSWFRFFCILGSSNAGRKRPAYFPRAVLDAACGEIVERPCRRRCDMDKVRHNSAG